MIASVCLSICLSVLYCLHRFGSVRSSVHKSVCTVSPNQYVWHDTVDHGGLSLSSAANMQ